MAKYQKYSGFTIESIQHVRVGDDEYDCLRIMFNNGEGLEFLDVARNCCEHRYMTIDDDLTEYEGAKFYSYDVADVYHSNLGAGYDVQDAQFLRIRTSHGDLSITNHNDHNGYYAGFDVICKEIHHTITTQSDS